MFEGGLGYRPRFVSPHQVEPEQATVSSEKRAQGRQLRTFSKDRERMRAFSRRLGMWS